MRTTRELMLCALLSLATATATNAGNADTTDTTELDAARAALADEIERLARRDLDGLVSNRRPDGTIEMDLQGRFRQVAIARLGADGEPMVGCVGTLDEAERFFGVELRTGKALPTPLVGPAPDSLATRAARHGMTPMQFRFYESLVDKAALPEPGKAATITISNGDDPGEGFNDTTPTTPVGGNNGTTRGQQRLNVFNTAAAIWGAFLDSPVPSVVAADFQPLFCQQGLATLGAAGPISVQGLSGGIVGELTVFPAALANKLVGSDISGNVAEIVLNLNSSIDSGCLPGTRFYYGLDNATPAGTINLLVVLLHELGHGLGSASFTAPNGAFAAGAPDIWSRFQFDRTVNLLWSEMTDAQRVASSTNPNNVLWDGPNVRIASGFLTAARDSNGRVELFTPNPFQVGSSVSHWNSTATPNLLMEPTINPGLPLDLDLTRQQMRDIGWFRDSNNDGARDTITNVQPSSGTLSTGTLIPLTWSNNGGFNRNVDIELSTDGGATFPTVISSNTTNSGNFAWFPPNIPTTQGRIRVRESGFAAPAAVSAANFTINTAPSFTPAAAVTRAQGSAAGAAVPIGTVADALTPAGDLRVTQSEFGGSTATGITVAGITNTNGSITATLAASCSATAGTVRFRVNDGGLNGFGDLQVNVDSNTPPTLTYAAQSAAVGASLTVNPATGPSDNGTIASTTLVSVGTYTGTISVGATNGVVSLSNLAPTGTHTITLRATDNCGATRDASFQLTVTGAPNTAPTFTPAAAITRQQGSPAPTPVTVGTVADTQTAAGSLFVSQIAGGTSSGVSATGITNSNGTISASVVATCTATQGTLRFQVNDGNLGGTGDLQVNVTANTAPTLTYAAQSGSPGGSLTVNPATGPTDNGVVTGIALLSQGTYTGTINVSNSTGVVSLSNLGPIGTHTITVRATDNCGATSDASFQLTVSAANTAPTFTPAAALTRQQGSGSPGPATVGTVADAQTSAGSLTITQVGGGTATGVQAVFITNTAGTVTAQVVANCTATSGTLRFQVSDGTLTGTGDLQVNVQANTPPVIAYAPQTVNEGGSLTVNPTTLTDNGALIQTSVASTGTYTGAASIGATGGVLSLSNAAPAGLHTITVRASDTCSATTDAPVSVQVNGDAVFNSSFEPASPRAP